MSISYNLDNSLTTDEFIEDLISTNKLRPHYKLAVWQKSITMIKGIYSLTNSFPKEERFGLTSQIRRASNSVALNVAEGAGRRGIKDKLRFMNIADASLSEVEACLIIALQLEFNDRTTFLSQLENCLAVGAPLHGLMRKLDSQI